MRRTQTQDNFLRQLFDGLAGCVHGEIGGAIERKALSVEVAEGFGRSSEWPRVLWRVLGSGLAALEQFFDCSFQKNDARSPALQQLCVDRLYERAATQRNHSRTRCLWQHRAQGGRLDFAKTGLAVQLE